jgi:hypothetical protein
MAKQKKDLVINLKPFMTEIRHFEGGFEWTFYATMAGNGCRRKRVRIRFERWWLTYLAKDLKKVLQAEIDELQRLQDLMGFKD